MSSTSELSHLKQVLDEILNHPTTTIRLHDSLIADKESLHSLYHSEKGYELEVRKLSIFVSDAALNKHRESLHKFFAPFADKNSGLIGITSIFKNAMSAETITVMDFIRRHVIRATVLLGTEKASRLLFDWKRGKEWTLTAKYHYLGVYIKSPMTVLEDRILPSKRENFETISSDEELGELNCESGAVIARNIQIDNMFFKPDAFSIPNNRINDIRFSMTDLGTCISLVQNNFVQLNCHWFYSRETHPFFPDNSPTEVEDIYIPQISEELDNKQLVKATELLPKLTNITSQSARFETAVERWKRSIYAFSNQDKVIELRIAMESLFTEGRGPSIRIFINAAKFLRTDDAERAEMFRVVREFYGIASDILHGEKRDVEEDYVRKIQNICREAILKVIEVGEMPDWNKSLLV